MMLRINSLLSAFVDLAARILKHVFIRKDIAKMPMKRYVNHRLFFEVRDRSCSAETVPACQSLKVSIKSPKTKVIRGNAAPLAIAAAMPTARMTWSDAVAYPHTLK